MATRPLTIVSLMKNIPLDADYNHTLYFANRDAQTAWFGMQDRKNFNPQTYQRVGTNQIRVNAPMHDLYEYNYLMFNNGNGVVLPDSENRYENKWFYAFISNVEYVNDNCALITYEIDVMQTFMFDYTFTRCFVEREHVLNDTIGEHIEPEPVATGEYVYNQETYHKLLNCSSLSTMIQYLPNFDPSTLLRTAKYDDIASQAFLAGFTSTSVLDMFIYQKLNDNPDAIVNLYTCPTNFINEDAYITGDGYSVGNAEIRSESVSPNTKVSNEMLLNGDALTGEESLDFYHPRNNKLYTYPYNFYCIDDSCGNTLNLRYEFFQNGRPRFKVVTNITPPVSAIIKPYNYKNSDVGELNTELIEMTNFPLAGTSLDAYQAYVAQNRGNLYFKMPAQVAASVASMASGNLIGGYAGVADVVSKFYQLSVDPNIGVGSASTGNASISHGVYGLYGGRVSVTANQARIIDDFFSMYGYAVNVVKVPEITNRPHWNYIKTVGCQINSSIPNIFANKIRSIYDNGITFWKNASEVGNYGLDNRPVE